MVYFFEFGRSVLVVSISRCVGSRCQIWQVRTVPTAFYGKDSLLHLESWICICHLISLTPHNCLDLTIVCRSLISFNLLQLSEVAPGAFMSGTQFTLLGLPLSYVARHRDRLEGNHCYTLSFVLDYNGQQVRSGSYI
jgi:hypothetical protein